MLEEQKYTEKELSDYYEAMKEKKSTIIYDSTREQLLNNLEQVKRLQEEGIHVGKLPEKLWQDIVELIEKGDCEKLGQLRQELKEIRK